MVRSVTNESIGTIWTNADTTWRIKSCICPDTIRIGLVEAGDGGHLTRGDDNFADQVSLLINHQRIDIIWTQANARGII
jgi:hypothetical protein